MTVIKRETDYAVRMLARLVGAEELLSVTLLAELEEVPPVFARKILQRLQRAGIVESARGPFGGYGLRRPAGEVSLLQVIEAVQGPIVMNECFSAPGVCRRARGCPLREHLGRVQGELEARLDSVSLREIAQAIGAAVRSGRGARSKDRVGPRISVSSRASRERGAGARTARVRLGRAKR